MKKLNSLMLMFVFVTSIGFAQNSLFTVPPLNGGNGSGGTAFVLDVNSPIVLDSIYGAFQTPAQSPEIWYTAVDTFGAPNIVAPAWTLIATSPQITGLSAGLVPTLQALPLSLNLTLQPGTYRFYVGCGTCSAIYTTWNAANQDVFSDQYITIRNGTNYGYGGAPPNPNFHPRQFNGGLIYTVAGGANDAAVLSVDSPKVFCAGTETVTATIGNFGANQIDSVDVNWEVNGVAQPTLKYIGLLDTLNGSNPNTAQVTLGTATFAAGTTNIRVFTSNPNGVTDTSNFNDTANYAAVTASPPTSIGISNVTLSSAQVSANGGAGTVEYEYGPVGFAQGTGTTGSSPTSTFTLTGLMQGTTYDIYVRSNCGAGDVSAYVGPQTFNTSYGVPYLQDFENWAAGLGFANLFPEGWSSSASTGPRWESEDATGANENSFGTGPFFDNTNPTTPGGLYCYLETSTGAGNDTLFSPPIYIDTNLSTVEFGFYYHMFGNSMGDLEVWADTNGTANLLVSYIGQQQLNQPDPWLQFSTFLTGYQGKSITLIFVGIRGTSFASDMSIDDITIDPVLPLNAGVTDLVSPSGSLCPGNVTPVVEIRNFGSSVLDSTNVIWDINGVLDSVKYTGPLAPGTTAQVSLGTVNVSSSAVYDIKFYTNNPNGMADQFNADDTLSINGLRTGLAGTVTINPALVPSATNFQTFAALENTLNSTGVCGTVTVNVSPGVYTENLTLDNIPGLDMNNTLTIDGGDSTLVTMSYGLGTNPYLISINNAPYVTIKNMTLVNTYTGTLDNYGVHLRGATHHDSLVNLHIKMNPTATIGPEGITASSDLANNFGEGDNANFTTVMGCRVEGGDYAYHFEGGTAGNWNVGNTFINNVAINMDEYGFYFDEQDSLTVEGNTISGNRNIQGDGIYGFDCMNMKINGNSVIVPDWGIYFADANSDKPSDFTAEFINNMIISQTDYGMYLVDAVNVNIFHNSIHTESTSNFGPAFRLFGAITDTIDLRNNIFSASSTLAFQIDEPDTAIFVKFDNNNFYRGNVGDLLNIDGATYPDLASYQTAQPLYNTASLDGDPQFASATNDLHIVGAFVNDNGDNSVNVLTDIDGETRPFTGATTVDIGADEFAPPVCPPPANVVVDSITDVSALVFWVSNTPGNVVEIELVPCGGAQGTGTVFNSTVDSTFLSGLTPSTCYEIYVREVCGRGDTSQWIGPNQFRTAIAGPRGVNCITGNASNTYIEEFDVIGGWTGDVNQGPLAGNWSFGQAGQTGSFNTGPSGPHSTTSYVYVETSGGANQTPTMVSPAIDLSQVSDSAELSFWMHAFGATIGTLNVGIGTSATGPFTQAFTWSGQLQTALTDPYQQIGIRLDQYVGQTIYVEFEYIRGTSFTSDMAIDLLQVIGCVSCPQPDSLRANNVALSSADLDWNENGTATNWQISWGGPGTPAGGGTVVGTTTKPYTLTGLTASTSYEYWVRSICGPGDTSNWVGPFAFNTANGIPWNEDFETFTPGTIANPFPNGWIASTGTNHRWESEDANNGLNENSVATGPVWDHTFFGGPTNGMYMYMETSSSTLGSPADFTSAPIFVGANSVVNFEYWYFNHGANIDRMEVLIDTNGVENLIATYTGQQQVNQATDPWLLGSHTLSGYQGKSIQIIFRGYGVACCSGDIAIDDISLTVPSPIDGGVSDIISPTSGCGLGAADSVEVEISNFGTNAISNFSVSYSLNGAAPVTETYTASIASGATATHVFSTTVNLSAAGTYNLDAWTTIASDGNVSNDSTNSVIDAQAVGSALPYTEDFETSTGGWVTYGANSSWAHGTPATTNTYITSAGQGTQAWVTNLNGTHNNNEQSFLESPCFDMSNEQFDPVFNFTGIYSTESGFDRGWVELSTDGGANWTKLIDLGGAVNWYNNTGGQYWEGNDPSGATIWDSTSNVMNGAAGSNSVKVRFAFSSDGSVTFEGMGVDDIFIDRVVGVQEQLANEANVTLYPNPSNGQFKLIMNTKQDADYTLQLRDAQGKLVFNEMLNVNGNFVKDYDFESLPKGVYFLNLQSDEESIVRKVVLQ